MSFLSKFKLYCNQKRIRTLSLQISLKTQLRIHHTKVSSYFTDKCKLSEFFIYEIMNTAIGNMKNPQICPEDLNHYNIRTSVSKSCRIFVSI